MQLAVNQEGTWLSPRASVKEQNTPVTEFKNWEKLSTLLEEGWPLTPQSRCYLFSSAQPAPLEGGAVLLKSTGNSWRLL